ncbi:MAG TPA: NAD(+) synthase, partial [Steroidobacteraceae bacterium]|nr:NAD(+) synthase [Steroidobacteraceae bacterium]
MMKSQPLSADRAFALDHATEIERIAGKLRHALTHDLNRRGLVVAISGGIDSSVSAALAVRAVGPKRVYGLLLPERVSSPQSTHRGRLLAEHLGIEYEIFDIAPALEALGCYARIDEVCKAVHPGYGAGWKNKIVLVGGLEGRYNHFKLVAQDPSGQIHEARLEYKQYLQIVAATNFKQRVRKTMEYFHADRLNYAVVGTPNRLEYDQGFFVKNGDGSADVKPIAHLYKSQVYALARFMKLPDEICNAIPTTDTYSLAQGQDEFYFGLPYAQMDLALWAYEHGAEPAALGTALGISTTAAEAVYADIEAKRRATRYLGGAP